MSLLSFQKNFCAYNLNHEFEATKFYHLPFKEFLQKMVFKEECGPSWNLRNFVSTHPHLNLEVVEFEKHNVYSSNQHTFNFIWKVHFEYRHPFNEETFGTLELL